MKNGGERVADFIFGGSKIAADGDFNHEIKRVLLLGRKVVTNLDSIFKSRDITLPKGTTEDEIVEWHHRLDGIERVWVNSRSWWGSKLQEGLACCSLWVCKESDTTERLNWTELIYFLYLSFNRVFSLNLTLFVFSYFKQFGFGVPDFYQVDSER